PPEPEVRQRNPEGEVEVVQPSNREELVSRTRMEEVADFPLAPPPPGHEMVDGARIFPYAVSRNRLARAINTLNVPATIVRHWDESDLVLTLRGQEKRRSSTFDRMRKRNMPIYSLKANTTAQIQSFL